MIADYWLKMICRDIPEVQQENSIMDVYGRFYENEYKNINVISLDWTPIELQSEDIDCIENSNLLIKIRQETKTLNV